jgi:hypothetical protein
VKSFLSAGAVVIFVVAMIASQLSKSNEPTDQITVDFSTPKTVEDIGHTITENKSYLAAGCNCVEVDITLPGGQNFTGMFDHVLFEEGPSGSVEIISLKKTATNNPLNWQTEMRQFGEQWGGEAIAAANHAYDLRSVMSDGGTFTGQTEFFGTPGQGFQPTLRFSDIQESSTGMSVAVEWYITVNPVS